MKNRDLVIVILAAGNGSRMGSGRQKVMTSVWGKPLLGWVLDAAFALSPQKVLCVTGHQADEVRAFTDACYGERVEFVEQEGRLGTGHAVRQTQKALAGYKGDVLVLCGDVPLVRSQTLQGLVDFHRDGTYHGSLLSTYISNPKGYGRIIRDEKGCMSRIVEERDCKPEELKIEEVNSGVTCFRAPSLFKALSEIRSDNKQGELYLTDVFHILKGQGAHVGALAHPKAEELLGVNSRAELGDMNRRVAHQWQARETQWDVARILEEMFSGTRDTAKMISG